MDALPVRTHRKPLTLENWRLNRLILVGRGEVNLKPIEPGCLILSVVLLAREDRLIRAVGSFSQTADNSARFARFAKSMALTSGFQGSAPLISVPQPIHTSGRPVEVREALQKHLAHAREWLFKAAHRN